MHGHPQGHFVSYHILTVGHRFIILEHASNNVNIVSSAGSWQGSSLVPEEVASRVDVVFDGVGSYCDAQDGIPLDD